MSIYGIIYSDGRLQYLWLIVVSGKCWSFTLYLLDRSTAQKMTFSIKDFLTKCDQIRRFLRVWSHLLSKSLMKSLLFCVVKVLINLIHNLALNYTDCVFQLRKIKSFTTTGNNGFYFGCMSWFHLRSCSTWFLETNY